MSRPPLIEVVEQLLKQNADTERALLMQAYMRDQYLYFGVMTRRRDELFKSARVLAAKDNPYRFAKEAWSKPEREFQYVAVRYLRAEAQNIQPNIKTLEYLITHKSWWDTVDELAAQVIGPMAKYNPHFEEQVRKWILSDNKWLQRTALIYQLHYKEQTDSDFLFASCRQLADEKDFFIRKAIGWALRQYSKHEPLLVQEFVAKTPTLSPLSQKEALRLLK